jgi:hypothetical protein
MISMPFSRGEGRDIGTSITATRRPASLAISQNWRPATSFEPKRRDSYVPRGDCSAQ